MQSLDQENLRMKRLLAAPCECLVPLEKRKFPMFAEGFATSELLEFYKGHQCRPCIARDVQHYWPRKKSYERADVD